MPQGPYAHPAAPMMDLNYIRATMTEMLNEYKEQETTSTYTTGKSYPPHVDMAPFSPKFVQPHFNIFNGTTCPKQHIAHFESHYGAIAEHGDLLKLFVQFPDGVDFTWYSNLKSYSIPNWDLMK